MSAATNDPRDPPARGPASLAASFALAAVGALLAVLAVRGLLQVARPESFVRWERHRLLAWAPLAGVAVLAVWAVGLRTDRWRTSDRGRIALGLALATGGALCLATPGLGALAQTRYVIRLAWLAAWALPLIAAALLVGDARQPPGEATPRRRASAPRVLGALFLAAVVWVLAVESGIEAATALGSSSMIAEIDPPASLAALIANALVLCAVAALLLAILGNLGWAASLTALAYAVLAVADAIKLRTLRSPFQPLDLLYLPELRTVLPGFVGPGVVAVGLLSVAALAAGSAAGLKPLRTRLAPGARWALAGLSLAFLALLPEVASSRPALEALESVGIRRRPWDVRRSAHANGLLVETVFGLDALVQEPPETYSRATVADAVRRTLADESPPAVEGVRVPVDVVLVMLESWMDPIELGLELGGDPTPFLRSLTPQGSFQHAISPSFGGLSANAEFELLSGLSMLFLPPDALPYRQHVKRELPSVARSFAEHGHRTVSIQADKRTFFDRPQALRMLGFDELLWPDEDPALERTANGRSVTDDVLVDLALGLRDDQRPFFALVFTNATHGPWDPREHPDSTLTVEADMPARASRELCGYLRSLEATDRALRRLVEGLADSPRPALVVVLGDHLPPFGGGDGVYRAARFLAGKDPRRLPRKFGVPVAVWSSYALPELDLEVSLNFLGARVLEAAGVRPRGFLAANRALGERLPVVSHWVRERDGTEHWRPRAALPDVPGLGDYALLQHDLLLGKRFAAEMWPDP